MPNSTLPELLEGTKRLLRSPNSEWPSPAKLIEHTYGKVRTVKIYPTDAFGNKKQGHPGELTDAWVPCGETLPQGYTDIEIQDWLRANPKPDLDKKLLSE